MKAYTIFDDFPDDAIRELLVNGVEITIHPEGKPRPNDFEMTRLLEDYECLIIGTSQKIKDYMLNNINGKRIIATASVGIDHIHIPAEKKAIVKIINTPKAVIKSVTEFTIACALTCCKRLAEGSKLYLSGSDNKALHRKPEDLYESVIGVVGAGNISTSIIQYASFLGMKVLCWTPHPENHLDITEHGGKFVSLEYLAANSDIISLNLPNVDSAHGIISRQIISLMKDTAIFISVSRLEILDINALLKKAFENPDFYICLDLDVNDCVVKALRKQPNILVTPHIAAGTIKTRQRMFREATSNIIRYIKGKEYNQCS